MNKIEIYNKDVTLYEIHKNRDKYGVEWFKSLYIIVENIKATNEDDEINNINENIHHGLWKAY